MSLHVHLEATTSKECQEAFQEQIGAGFSITTGEIPPQETQIWVVGRPSEVLLELPKLQAVIVPFAGIPAVTIEWIRKSPELTLYNLHFNNRATAEMAVALLLAIARDIVRSDQELRNGRWSGRTIESTQYNLYGKTATLLGYGAIGQQCETVLNALGVRCLPVHRTGQGERSLQKFRQNLMGSEILVSSVPLTPKTKDWIGKDHLMLMRPPRLIVNVGRGAVFIEQDLFELAQAKEIRLASDVWFQYPTQGKSMPSQFPFENLENVVMSPHQGGDGDQIERERGSALALLVRNIATGTAQEPVNIETGY